MADLVFNIAKGRAVQLALNVDNASPANSALIVIPVSVGAVADDTIRDCDTFAAVTSAGVTALSTNGWARKTVTASGITMTLDDTANTYTFDIDPDLTWTSVTSGTSTDLIICYDADTTAGTDADLIPLVLLDFAVTPDGSNVVAQFNASGVLTAS